MSEVMRLRKRPVEIEGIQFTGDNAEEVAAFVGPLAGTGLPGFMPGDDRGDGRAQVWVQPERAWVPVPINHWVLRGVSGEFYPCDREILAQTYDVLDSCAPPGPAPTHHEVTLTRLDERGEPTGESTRTTVCTCGPDKSRSGCDVHVECDDGCRALLEPVTVEELRAALEHWRDHSVLFGCSHGC